MNRRRLLQGLALSPLLACGASRAERLPARGCALLLRNHGQVYDVARGIGIVEREPDTGIGDPAQDRALGRALVRVSQLFGERPSFGFIDDGKQPNAYATDETRVAGTWGAVLFGRRLFSDLMRRFDDGGIAVLAVVAHEFAHIAQYHRKTYDTLIGAPRRSKRAELHADFLSGFYLGVRKSQAPSLQLRTAGVHLFQIGDFEFNDHDHHGTPDERVEAAERGFSLSRRSESFPDAFVAGRDWVLRQHEA
jgi:hypothetical protein